MNKYLTIATLKIGITAIAVVIAIIAALVFVPSVAKPLPSGPVIIEPTQQKPRVALTKDGETVTSPAVTLPTTGPKVAMPDSIDLDVVARGLHVMINYERATKGLPYVSWNDTLAKIAKAHSQDEVDNAYMSHINSKSQDATARAEQAGYYCYKEFDDGTYRDMLGENLSFGYVVPSSGSTAFYTNDQIVDKIFQGWKNSPEHYANIIQADFDTEGIAVVGSDFGYVLATEVLC